jgi:arylformamidase
MPYFIAPMIVQNQPGLWGEGSAYNRDNIHSLINKKLHAPPVNYDSHTLKPHSISHFDAPLHVLEQGSSIDKYFSPEKLSTFYGKVTLVKLRNNNYKMSKISGIYHWEVSLDELQTGLLEAQGTSEIPEKLLLTTDPYKGPQNDQQDPNFVLTLSIEAAKWLCSSKKFNLYGTSWKSSDFQPGKSDRPIHKILFDNALILECLALNEPPKGVYFIVCPPLPLMGASESPASPLLFSLDEINRYLQP